MTFAIRRRTAAGPQPLVVPSSFPQLPLPTFEQLSTLVLFARPRDTISGTLKTLLCSRGMRNLVGATLGGVDVHPNIKDQMI